MQSENSHPIFVSAQEGSVLDFIWVTHKLTGRQTHGAYYAFESTFEPGGGNRLHVHSREDEFAYVLEGALEVRLKDEVHILEAGGDWNESKNQVRRALPGAKEAGIRSRMGQSRADGHSGFSQK